MELLHHEIVACGKPDLMRQLCQVRPGGHEGQRNAGHAQKPPEVRVPWSAGCQSQAHSQVMCHNTHSIRIHEGRSYL